MRTQLLSHHDQAGPVAACTGTDSGCKEHCILQLHLQEQLVLMPYTAFS